MKRKLECIFIFLLILLNAGPLCEANDADKASSINISASVDKEKVDIGDKIKLDIVVEDQSGFEVLFPEVPERLGNFSFVSSKPIKSGWRGKREIGREYILGIYTTGPHVIPPIKVMYRGEGETEWQVKQSPRFPIAVMSVLTGNDTDIKDLKGLVLFGSRFSRRFFVLVSLLGLAVVLCVLWKKRQFTGEREASRIRSPYEIAHEELKQLEAMDLPGKGQIKEYYTRLSDIIRRYLESRFSYKAPEMTTEEFLDFIKGSSELGSEHKGLLKDFLSGCDMVKFAKYGPTPIEILDSFKAAERLVEQTREKEELEEVRV